jgi:hypothetical protein
VKIRRSLAELLSTRIDRPRDGYHESKAPRMRHFETLHERPFSILTWSIASASKLVWAVLIAGMYYANPERQSDATPFVMAMAYVLVFIPAAVVLLVAVPLAFYRAYRHDRLRTRSDRLPLAFGGVSFLATLVVLTDVAGYYMGWPDFLDGIL